MDKRTELLNILRAEMTLLTKEILQNIHQQDLNELYKSSRKLYEKMAAIHLIDKQFADDNAFNLLLNGQSNTSNETAVTEKPAEKEILNDKTENTNPYQKVNQMTFIPKDKPVEKSVENQTETTIPVSGKKINIGLNDKIAFINNLFNGNEKAYNDVINRLNAFENYESALTYIYKEVKPNFNYWEGKDEYEFRLIQLLELKFN
jgi:hypothetical protein